MKSYSCNSPKKLMELGVNAPGGQKTWHAQAIKRILTNEKYCGDAPLQKKYIPDYLTKKQVVNHGEIPQYYVEDIHEAIIDKLQFQRVQDEIARRQAANVSENTGEVAADGSKKA